MGQPATVPFEGMPERDVVRLSRRDGVVVIGFGHRVLYRYDDGDVGLRNLALVSLCEARLVSGLGAAELFGLSPGYVSALRVRIRRQGSVALVPPMGRPPKLDAKDRATALRLAAEGMAGQDIAARLGVSGATISRLLAGAPAPLSFLAEETAPGDAEEATDPNGTGEEATGAPGPAPTSPLPVPIAGSARPCRYAGAMLLWPFLATVGFEDVFAGVRAGPARRYDDLSVLGCGVFGFALGASSLEGVKHLGRADLGTLVGRDRAPELHTLRPRLGAIADACDPVEVQTALARGLRASDEAPSQVFFVDDHFVAYSGAQPVAKGWDARRRHACKGRTDTYVVDLGRRALCFSSAEPTGLSRTIGGALAQLRDICGPGSAITLGFDRGGSYPVVFSHLRDEGVTWVSWRRAEMATPAVAPRRSWFGLDGRRHSYLLADETIDLDGYGPARQVTIFEGGVAVAQVLTSDTSSTAARMVHLLRCRWRIENVFKYLGDHHGIGWLCEYAMDLVPDDNVIDNPQRKTALATLRAAQAAVGGAEAALGRALVEGGPAAGLKERIGVRRDDVAMAKDDATEAKAAIKAVPAKVVATDVDPKAVRAVPRLRRRSLQMVLRLLAYNAELWLSDRLDAYLNDPDEVRALTRHLLHQPGTVTFAAEVVSVVISRPDQARVARALALLVEELNAAPAHLPGDHRTVIYDVSEG